MKLKNEYTEKEYIAEVVALWEEVVRTVYLKKPGVHAAEIAVEGWEETNMTPLDYVSFVANPRNLTNQVNWGQKSRETRWDHWILTKRKS